MRGDTHVLCGYVTSAFVFATSGPSFYVGCATVYPIALGFFSSIGSLLPDIDMQYSSYGRKHKLIAKLFKHRGFTHTLIVPMILALSIYFVTENMYDAAFATMYANAVGGILLGYICHIIADSFNSKGVPLLWPINDKKISFASFTTGTYKEKIFLFLYTGVHLGLIFLI